VLRCERCHFNLKIHENVFSGLFPPDPLRKVTMHFSRPIAEARGDKEQEDGTKRKRVNGKVMNERGEEWKGHYIGS